MQGEKVQQSCLYSPEQTRKLLSIRISFIRVMTLKVRFNTEKKKKNLNFAKKKKSNHFKIKPLNQENSKVLSESAGGEEEEARGGGLQFNGPDLAHKHSPSNRSFHWR